MARGSRPRGKVPLASLRNFASFAGDKLNAARSSGESASRNASCESRNAFRTGSGADPGRRRLRHNLDGGGPDGRRCREQASGHDPERGPTISQFPREEFVYVQAGCPRVGVWPRIVVEYDQVVRLGSGYRPRTLS